VLRMRAGLDNSAANADSNVSLFVVVSKYHPKVFEMSTPLTDMTLKVNWNPKNGFPGKSIIFFRE